MGVRAEQRPSCFGSFVLRGQSPMCGPCAYREACDAEIDRRQTEAAKSLVRAPAAERGPRVEAAHVQHVSAPGVLQKAAHHMLDRAATYDKSEGERSMGKVVQAFNAITGRDLSEAEGWLLLQVLKDVRLFQRPGYHADSAEDCAAYAALKAEAKAREVA